MTTYNNPKDSQDDFMAQQIAQQQGQNATTDGSSAFDEDDHQAFDEPQDDEYQDDDNEDADEEEEQTPTGNPVSNFLTSKAGLLSVGGVLVAMVVAGVYFAFSPASAPPPPPQEQFEEQPKEQKLDLYAGQMVFNGLPMDHWARKTDIVGGLVEAAVGEAITKTPEYNTATSSLHITPEVAYALNSPEYLALRQEVINKVLPVVQPTMSTQVNPDTGQALLLLQNTPEAIEQGALAFDVIKEVAMYDTVFNQTVAIANAELAQAIAAHRNRIPAPVKQEEPKVVDTGISQAQRNEFKRLLDEQRNWNEELKRENSRLREEMQNQNKQVTQLVQSIEDDPTSRAKLQLKALNSGDYKVQAVQGNLVFLQDKRGEIHSVKIGQRLPNSEYTLSAADAVTGLVYISK